MTRRLNRLLERDGFLETALSPSGEISLSPLAPRGAGGRGYEEDELEAARRRYEERLYVDGDLEALDEPGLPPEAEPTIALSLHDLTAPGMGAIASEPGYDDPDWPTMRLGLPNVGRGAVIDPHGWAGVEQGDLTGWAAAKAFDDHRDVFARDEFDVSREEGYPPSAYEHPGHSAPFDAHVDSGDGMMASAPPRRRRRDLSLRPCATWRDDLITALLGLTLAVGLLLEGWNQLNRGGDGGVFPSVWQGLLWTGLTGAALWSLTRHQEPGRLARVRLPRGYGPAVLGIGIGFAAFLGDAAWHTMLGGQEVWATISSPFRLVLLVASLSLAATALRSMWLKPDEDGFPTVKAFAPVLLSTIAATSVTLFAVQFQSPLAAWNRPDAAGGGLGGLAAVMLTNLVLLGSVLLLLRRWRPPLGSVTLLYGTVALIAAGVANFARPGPIFGALLAGLAADLMIHYSTGMATGALVRRVGFVAPAVFWAAWLVAAAAFEGTASALGLGAVVLAPAAGFALSLVAGYRLRPEPWPEWESEEFASGYEPTRRMEWAAYGV